MSLIVLLYSKYSTHCDTLQYRLNQHVEYRKLCVDHEETRSRLKQNQTANSIIVVPTLLIFHKNGETDKLEGKQCFEWVDLLERQANANQEKEVEKPSIIPIDEIAFEERKLDSSPLIKKDLENDIEDMNKGINEVQAESSIQKNNSGDNIMNLAQQMQKERGLEEKT